MSQRFRVLMFAALMLCSTGLVNGAPPQSPAGSPQAPAQTTAPAPAPVQKYDPKNPTADQIAEFVILIYGTRERMAQIQRNGIERGRVTRLNTEGRTEEISYERRFVRGETSEKDKIRLDQKLPSAEYAIVYNAGRVWGIINGTVFTPRQEAVNEFLTQSKHNIGMLLRYKENGATLALAGREKQKGIDMFVVDLIDKEKQRTRFYISSQKYRVLWLEYEENPAAGALAAAKPVLHRRTFHDYRYAQGQLVPFRTVLYEDGKQAEETNILNVSFGLKMDDTYFQDTPATADAQP